MLKTKQIDAYKNQITNEKDLLVVQYIPAVKAMAYRLKERLPSSVDVNELISVGLEEMVKISKRYDKKLNDSFWGYAKQRVNGSMLDFLRSLDILSRGNRKIAKQIKEESLKYADIHSIEPDNEYLAKKLNISVEKINEVKNSIMVASVMPINEQILFLNENDSYEEVERDDLLLNIKSILGTMSLRDQTIIQLYYYEELNLKEISEVIGIGESRISQIHKKLLETIRNSFEK